MKRLVRVVLAAAAAVLCIGSLAWGAVATSGSVPKYGEYEISLTGGDHKNPYMEVELSAVFTGPKETMKVNGFWDGGKLFKVRFMPMEQGKWSWKTISNDPKLNGQSGSLTCGPSTGKGYVRVSKSHPFGFEWTDGTPFFLLGDTMWHMYYKLDMDGTFQKVIDARAKQGFNYIQGVVDSTNRTQDGVPFQLGASNAPTNCDVLFPAYFQQMDKKVAYMNSRGVVAAMVFAWGNERYKEFKTPEQYQRYLKYVVARYGSRNVFWMIAGEFEEAGEKDANWISYMDTVAANDPYGHPSSMHTINVTDKFGNVPAHTVIGQQRKGDAMLLAGLITKSRQFNKPVVNLEYGYESTTNAHRAAQSADDVRSDHWCMSLAGGYGVYGNGIPGWMTYHGYGNFNPDATNSLGAKQLGYLYDFFTSIKFEDMAPSPNLTDKGICAMIPGSDYIVYIPTGGVVTVDLTGATGSFKTDWLDPKSGKTTPGDPVTGGAKRSFTSPWTAPAWFITDWVLHLHR